MATTTIPATSSKRTDTVNGGEIWPIPVNGQRVAPLAIALLGAAILTGCGSDDDKIPSSADNGRFNGVWQSAEDGEVLEIENNKLTRYEYTSNHCLATESSSGKLADVKAQGWQLNDDKTRITLKLDYLGVNYIDSAFSKIDAMPELCEEDNLTTQYFADDYQADPTQDYQIFWDTFNEYYPSFDRRGLDWAATDTAFSGQIGADTTDGQLFGMFNAMIQPLQDSHIEVTFDDNAVNYMRGETFDKRLQAEFLASDAVDGNIDTDEEYQAYLAYISAQYELMNEIRLDYATSDLQQAANDELLWYTSEQEGSTVGVLILSAMSGFVAGTEEPESLEEARADLDALQAAITHMLTDVQDTDGLIIDVRDNPGGNDFSSQLLVRHFLDTERTLYRKQSRLGNGLTDLEDIRLAPADQTYTKPIVILTSPMTESAAEVFALAMSELPHVTLMGEPSQGALSDLLERQLPNGMTFSLVNEYYYNTSGDWYEGQGIPVDVTIPFMTLEQRDNEEDLALEAAWEVLVE